MIFFFTYDITFLERIETYYATCSVFGFNLTSTLQVLFYPLLDIFW